jgi:LPS-assembly lipoprotein
LAGLSVETVSAAVTPGGAITRYDLVGRAPWRLTSPGGAVLAQGEATAFTGYSATGTTVATTAAEADARGRLMALLADAVVTRLLILPPSLLPAPGPAGRAP